MLRVKINWKVYQISAKYSQIFSKGLQFFNKIMQMKTVVPPHMSDLSLSSFTLSGRVRACPYIRGTPSATSHLCATSAQVRGIQDCGCSGLCIHTQRGGIADTYRAAASAVLAFSSVTPTPLLCAFPRRSARRPHESPTHPSRALWPLAVSALPRRADRSARRPPWGASTSPTSWSPTSCDIEADVAEGVPLI